MIFSDSLSGLHPNILTLLHYNNHTLCIVLGTNILHIFEKSTHVKKKLPDVTPGALLTLKQSYEKDRMFNN